MSFHRISKLGLNFNRNLCSKYWSNDNMTKKYHLFFLFDGKKYDLLTDKSIKH